ncbi:sensor histidine kinase [Candidatus Laterigemmans baculatus]|uniref:sensor histidine kinase n=1 Tax=Candidatus Laterigemmans baculatus TaxID=2770505 RepID=UPI0021BC34E7|nr:HAMP domain-containing sensor histidine kinase [Candidatus Laterigemmans baculatus]
MRPSKKRRRTRCSSQRNPTESFAGNWPQRERSLAMLSHELRNPLAPLLTALGVLQVAPERDPIQREALGLMERQVRQLVRLIDDLLDTSRLTAGKLQVRKEPVELNEIVERAAQTARPVLEERQHAFSLSLAMPSRSAWRISHSACMPIPHGSSRFS